MSLTLIATAAIAAELISASAVLAPKWGSSRTFGWLQDKHTIIMLVAILGRGDSLFEDGISKVSDVFAGILPRLIAAQVRVMEWGNALLMQ